MCQHLAAPLPRCTERLVLPALYLQTRTTWTSRCWVTTRSRRRTARQQAVEPAGGCALLCPCSVSWWLATQGTTPPRSTWRRIQFRVRRHGGGGALVPYSINAYDWAELVRGLVSGAVTGLRGIACETCDVSSWFAMTQTADVCCGAGHRRGHRPAQLRMRLIACRRSLVSTNPHGIIPDFGCDPGGLSMPWDLLHSICACYQAEPLVTGLRGIACGACIQPLQPAYNCRRFRGFLPKPRVNAPAALSLIRASSYAYKGLISVLLSDVLSVCVRCMHPRVT